LPASETPAVQRLLELIHRDGADLLGFAKAYRDFDRLVQEGGKGFSLDEYYRRLPETLRGCIELSYDLNNHPKVRVYEELLYDQQLNDPTGREIGLSMVADRDRKFFLTNPRTDREGSLFVPMGFRDKRIDLLSRLRIAPMKLQSVVGELSLASADAARLHQFLTTSAPVRKSTRFAGEGVRVRYFGHACVLLETAGTTILLDPLFAWERDDSLASLTFHDLPDRIDFVVFSHAHMDHFCPEVIVQLRERVGCFIVPQNNQGEISDPSMKLMLKALGCQSIRALDPFDRVEVADGQIVSLPFPGEHCGLSIFSKHSVLIELLGRRFLFLVDSDAVDSSLYTRIQARVGHVNAAFVGMECDGAPLSWFYGPLLARTVTKKDDDSRRGNASNSRRAWDAISQLDCERVYVYAMGNEPWNRHLLGLEYTANSVQITESTRFVEQCRAEGIHAERLHGCTVMNY
jgi:L-ascorbate metabolism protein UlaG (beta-lactamase superfamily)